MKRSFLLVGIVLVSSCLVVGQQQDSTGSTSAPPGFTRPPTVAQVTKFFEVMHIKDQMQVMLQAEQRQLDAMMNDMLKKYLPNATAKQQAQFKKLTTDAIDDLMKNYPIDDVLRDMIPVYQAHLTESDLDQVIVFYSSATGQRLLKEMPAMTQEAMRVSYARLQPEIDKLIKNMQANVQRMVDEDNKNEKDAAPAESGK